MSHPPERTIRGQESLILQSSAIRAAIAKQGAMLAPVEFFPDAPDAFSPYAVAPWAEETPPANTPPMVSSLRGDWFCSAFGENDEAHCGVRLPPHGETANEAWTCVGYEAGRHGQSLTLGLDLPLQGGRCEARTTLLQGQTVIYQRHDLSGLSGPINPGHHATLQFPDDAGSGRLSFSRLVHARTYIQPTERPESGGRSLLVPDQEIKDLRRVRCVDGSTTDLLRYPSRRGFEDIVILCADPQLPFAWSAVTFPNLGFVWFSLRNPRQLASTLLWSSNGGRPYPPWYGRHVNVMGIEDITAFFHVGIAASCRPNPLTERGIATCLLPDRDGRLSIPYIQAAARIPRDFGSVADIVAATTADSVYVRAEGGAEVNVRCHLDFLCTGELPDLGDTCINA